MTCIGSMSLRPSIISLEHLPKPGKQHRFRVMTADRCLYLQARSEEDMQEWMAALTAVRQRLQRNHEVSYSPFCEPL